LPALLLLLLLLLRGEWTSLLLTPHTLPLLLPLLLLLHNFVSWLLLLLLLLLLHNFICWLLLPLLLLLLLLFVPCCCCLLHLRPPVYHVDLELLTEAEGQTIQEGHLLHWRKPTVHET
jgi:hypothetical protein